MGKKREGGGERKGGMAMPKFLKKAQERKKNIQKKEYVFYLYLSVFQLIISHRLFYLERILLHLSHILHRRPRKATTYIKPKVGFVEHGEEKRAITYDIQKKRNK